MNTKHTPGPWQVDPGWNTALPTIAAPLRKTSSERGLIADLTHTPFLEQSAANARLIAAAPELAEALRDIVAYAEIKRVETGDQLPPWIDNARAVLAKLEEKP